MNNSELFQFKLIECSDAAATKFMQPMERTDYSVCNFEYVLSGYGYLKCAGHFWKLAPGDVYIMRKHEDHCYYQDRDDPWKKRYIVTDGPLMESVIANTLKPDDYVFRRCEKLRHYFDSFFAMAKDPAVSASESALLFHQLVIGLTQHRENMQKETRSRIEQNLKDELDRSLEKTFVLELYAEKTGLSKSYLIRKFRQSFGITPYEYLLQAKVRKSEELLRYTPASVKEIADRLGFIDQSAFSRCFKQKIGQTPTECREQSRK